MQYALDKISTVQAHDALLVQAQQKKRTLERRRRNLGEAISAFSQRIDRISKEMAEVGASLAALTPAYHAMPEGKDKATLNVMIKRLALRLARLEKQAYTCNVAFLLVKELKYNMLDSQVSALECYIHTLERVKTARSQSTLSAAQPGDLHSPVYRTNPSIQPDTFSDHAAPWPHPLIQTARPRHQYEPAA